MIVPLSESKRIIQPRFRFPPAPTHARVPLLPKRISSLVGGKMRDPGNELAHPPVRMFFLRVKSRRIFARKQNVAS